MATTAIPAPVREAIDDRCMGCGCWIKSKTIKEVETKCDAPEMFKHEIGYCPFYTIYEYRYKGNRLGGGGKTRNPFTIRAKHYWCSEKATIESFEWSE